MNGKFTKFIALLVVLVLLTAVPGFSARAEELSISVASSDKNTDYTTGNETNNTDKEETKTTKTTKNPSTTEPTTQPTTEPTTKPTTKPAAEAVKSIKFTVGESCKIGVEEGYQFCVKDQNNKTVKNDITYSSSSESIVTVNSSGKITGKKAGTATITAKTKNGKKAVCKVTVDKAATGIKLNITSATIGVGEKSVDLNSTTLGGYSRARKYSSSNGSIASVDINGVVTGVKEGTATITCVTFNNKKATCKITVRKKPTSIKITNSNKTVQKNSNNHQIKYALSSGAGSYKITYSVKDKSIATINSKGVVTGKKCGKTTVTVKTYNGLTASQEITVNDNSLSLNINSTQLALDNDNVTKVKYGTSVQKRNLEGFIITNGKDKISESCKINVNGSVNVRSGAGTSYKTVATLKNGTSVTRIEKSVKKADGYTWDKIKFGNNQTGYVATNYVKFVKNNVKTIFMDFAVHGFEDEYYRDGQVLVKEANALIDYFAKHPTELKDYRLVIVLSLIHI